MRPEDISPDVPFAADIIQNAPSLLANGGSCLAGPDGNWVLAPVVEKEILLVATIHHKEVRRERQNFDPSGHYSRPDVLQLHVDRQRQCLIKLKD